MIKIYENENETFFIKIITHIYKMLEGNPDIYFTGQQMLTATF